MLTQNTGMSKHGAQNPRNIGAAIASAYVPVVAEMATVLGVVRRCNQLQLSIDMTQISPTMGD
jgi:hypothetical protein